MKTKQEIWDEVLRRGFCVNDGVAVQVLIDVLDFCGVFGEDTTEDGEADDMAAEVAGCKADMEVVRAGHKAARAGMELRIRAERDKAAAEIAELKRELELSDLRREEAIACNTEVWDLLGGSGRLVDRVREVMEERSRAIRKRTEADDARREVYAELHKAHAELARCQGDLEVTHHQQQAAIDDACENVRAHERAKLEAARAGFEAVRPKLEEAVNQLGIERDKDKRHMAGTGLERAVDIIEVLVDTDACRLDHHGACQTHGCTRPCIMPLAIAWLVEQGRGRG